MLSAVPQEADVGLGKAERNVTCSRPTIVILAALALLGGCSSTSVNEPAFPGTSTPALNRRIPGKISNIIVIIQENRSFDDFFAGYPGANAPMTGCGVTTSGIARKAVAPLPVPATTGGSGCPSGDIPIPLREVNFKDNPDIRHDWYSSMLEWNNGNMDGWTRLPKKHNHYAGYVYENHGDVAPYWTMARQYVLADAMFPTEFGGSFTGHLTLVAGTDDIKLPGSAEVDFPNNPPDDCDSPPGTVSSYLTKDPYRKEHKYKGPFPCFDQFNTMAQVLDDAGISWRIYANKLVGAGFWEPFEAIKYVRDGPDWKHDVSAPETKVLKDAMNGNLASVSWVTPSGADSDHPHYHSDAGPSWVSSVVNAIGESNYWSSSAIIVVWDDWGGSYDNAKPPQLDYRGLGIRVPCIIISPYAKEGYVTHKLFEWGSILRFIEVSNGLPAGSIGSTAQGYTDGRANNLDDAFDYNQSPRPFKPIGAKYPMSHFLHEPPSDAPVDTQ